MIMVVPVALRVVDDAIGDIVCELLDIVCEPLNIVCELLCDDGVCSR